jgi:hypothetical protein
VPVIPLKGLAQRKRRTMARSKAKPDADRAGSIYRTLRHAIIEQALAPGAKLPEDAIGERFGASRTIVRSALGQPFAGGIDRTLWSAVRRARSLKSRHQKCGQYNDALGEEFTVRARLLSCRRFPSCQSRVKVEWCSDSA